MRLPTFRSGCRSMPRAGRRANLLPEVHPLEPRVVLAATPVPIDIANHSFESSAATDGAVIGVALWTMDGSFGNAFNPTAAEYVGADDDADSAGLLTGPGDQKQVLFINDIATASQQLTTTVEASKSYALTVAVGDRSDMEMQDYSIALFAGATLIASTTGDGEAATDGGFTDVTIATPVFSSGDPLVGQPLRIELSNLGTKTTTAVQVNFDNVRLTATEVFPAELQEQLDAIHDEAAARKGKLGDAIESLIAILEAQAQAQQASADAAVLSGAPNAATDAANAQLLAAAAAAIDGMKTKADAVIDSVRDRVNQSLADIREMADDIARDFREELPKALKEAKKELKEMVADFRQEFRDIGQLVKETVRDIKKEVIPVVKAQANNFVAEVKLHVDNAKAIGKAVVQAAEAVADTTKQVVRDAGNAASDAVNWAANGIKKLFKKKR